MPSVLKVPVSGLKPVVLVAVSNGARMACTSVTVAATACAEMTALPAASSLASLPGSPEGDRREAMSVVIGVMLAVVALAEAITLTSVWVAPLASVRLRHQHERRHGRRVQRDAVGAVRADGLALAHGDAAAVDDGDDGACEGRAGGGHAADGEAHRGGDGAAAPCARVDAAAAAAARQCQHQQAREGIPSVVVSHAISMCSWDSGPGSLDPGTGIGGLAATNCIP
ncbi:hypothetical protein ACFJGX_21720 [Hydrogenophaga sp. UC242_50]|uniref:hypothetical protein n=1 Tax=Hydrogenophaga sp. UC242_50 TaxID=3350169 RepID=UPI0036D34C27